jgi:outer membrane receptor for ferrienterochelin and colicin
VSAPAALAQQGQAPPSSQAPPQPDQPITFEDQVVVSASRAEEEFVNAPATVSVISAQSI